MNQPLVLFVLLSFVVISALGWLLRRAISAVTTTAADHAKIYAAAYVKGGALILLAMFSAFEKSFQPLTAEAALHLSWWDWTILFISPLAAGLAVLVAFLDRSTQKASEEAANFQAKKDGSSPPFPSVSSNNPVKTT